MSETYTIAVIGAGGKMGMRVSNNLVKTDHDVRYVENSPAGQARTREAGRALTDGPAAVADADIIVLAVPDLALAAVTAEYVPQLKPGAICLTLDPAAAYAGAGRLRHSLPQGVLRFRYPSAARRASWSTSSAVTPFRKAASFTIKIAWSKNRGSGERTTMTCRDTPCTTRATSFLVFSSSSMSPAGSGYSRLGEIPGHNRLRPAVH